MSDTESQSHADETIGLRAQIKEDWRINGSDWTLPGFRAVAVHRFGVWRMGIRNRLFRAPFSWLYRILYRRVRNHYGIELHYTTTVGRRLLIAHQGGIVVHHHCMIGDDCIIRQGVTIGGARQGEDQAPTLGDRVNMAAGSMVLGRVKIGDDVTIGPNAVVMTNVSAGATVTNPPPRVIPTAKKRVVDSESE